jgi:hypothetical protein
LSAISYIYSEIKTQLETVVGIGFVGKWNNQLENDSRERQFTYPCVLIEFGSVEWLNTDQRPSMSNSDYQQKGLVEITIHTLFKSVDNSTDTFEDHIDFCKLIWDALTNFQDSLEGFTPLQRVRDIDDSNHDTVRDWQTVYSSMIFEAANSQNLVDAAPVSVTIIGQLPSQSTPEVAIPICADADVYLNDVPIWTVESGGLLELSIVNQDDLEVTPISVVGNVIKVDTTAGVCDDASYTLKSNDLTVISSGTIPSGGSDDIIAPNATVTYNGGTVITAIQSNQSEDLTFEYENGDTANPTSVVGTVLTFPNLQSTFDPRDLIDHTTLNWINPFGNNSRFTDTLGTQLYVNGIVIDWTSYNIPASTVSLYLENSVLYSGTYANAITYYPGATIGGLSGWRMGTFSELSNLIIDSAVINNYLNYAPFNYHLVSQIRVNTLIGLNHWTFSNNGISPYVSSLWVRLNFAVRDTPLSELGL